MEIKLLNVLDFFYFRKEFKRDLDLNFFNYLKMMLLDDYLFYLKNSNGTIAILKASKSSDLEFKVSNIYELDKPFINLSEKDNLDNHVFLYSSNKQEDLPTKIGFKKTSMDEFMLLNLNDFNFDTKVEDKKFTFERLEKGKNEKFRCEIQNEAFNSEKRFPLKTKDIKYEMSRKSYIPELAYFIKDKDIYIGYGQILYLDGKYTVVNLSVMPTYQGKGVGTEILTLLLEKAVELNIENIFIKVKSDNIVAKKLYLKLGFKIIEKTTFFEM